MLLKNVLSPKAVKYVLFTDLGAELSVWLLSCCHDALLIKRFFAVLSIAIFMSYEALLGISI